MEAEPFNLPSTIIKEGKIDSIALKQIHRDEDWVVSSLESLYQTEVKNVLLATLDKNGNLKVYLYK